MIFINIVKKNTSSSPQGLLIKKKLVKQGYLNLVLQKIALLFVTALYKKIKLLLMTSFGM